MYLYMHSRNFILIIALSSNTLMAGTRISVNVTHHAPMKDNCHENYDPCFPDQPVVDLYLPIWAKQPCFKSKPAFIWAEDGAARSLITYSQLDSSACLTASKLLVPLQRGDTVLILCSPGLLLVKTLFACQRAGLVSVPISPPDDGPSSQSTTQRSLHHLIRVILQTKPKAAVAHRSQIMGIRRSLSSSSNNTLLCRLLQELRWLPVDDFECGVDDNSTGDYFNYHGCKPDEVYLIQYTSGATGIPKPVLVTAGAAAHNVRAARKAYDLQPNSVIVSWLPQYHDCGLMFLLLNIVSGATCVLTSPAKFVKRPRCWLELISEFDATCTPVPSFALPLAVRRGGVEMGGPLKLGSLRNLVLINEPIYRAPVEEFINEFSRVGLCQSSISPSYGLAENCTFVSTAWRNTGEGNSGSFPNIPSYKQLLPSARLASWCSKEDYYGEEEMEIIVVNKNTDEPVKDGVEGEIWVSSPSNASGYLGYPSLTHEVFYSRLKGKVSRNFVRTGDRGIVVGEERYLFVMGRVTDVIRTDGLELHPHNLETAAYSSCSKHLRAGCIAAFEFSMVIAVVAELRRLGGGTDLYRSVCEGIREAVLKHENVGIGLVVLVRSGSIPKTTSGKLQRWAAKEMLTSGEMQVVSKTWFMDGEMSLSSSSSGNEMGEKGGEMGHFNDDHHHLFLLSML